MGRTAVRIENLVQRGDAGGRGGSWRCIVGSEVSIEAARHVRSVESPPAGGVEGLDSVLGSSRWCRE